MAFEEDDSGFLMEPVPGGTPNPNPDVHGWEHWESVPLLVLLGEPGAGKTEELKRQYREERERNPEGRRAFHIDLSRMPTAKPIADLFDPETGEAWESFQSEDNGSTATLYVDSLDDGPLIVADVIEHLVQELWKIDLSRLRLRLACRIAEWRQDYIAALSELVPSSPDQQERSRVRSEPAQAIELLPFTRRQAEDFADAAHADGATLVDEALRLGLGPLAAQPLTLKMLVDSLRSRNELPANRFEAYSLGLQALAWEPDKRQQRRRRWKLAVPQRLAVARRIGAMTVMGNRRAISWNAPRDMREDQLSAHHVIGGKVACDFGDVDVDRQAVEETLDTALFTGRRADDLDFSHRSYAEFLAAQALDDPARLPLDALKRDWLCVTWDREARVPAPLRDVAAWLASPREDVRDWLLEREPEILLRGDVSAWPDEIRARLVHRLFQRYEGRERFDDSGLWTHYRKLKHPELAGQLESHLTRSQSQSLRLMAIRVATACSTRELGAPILEMARDQREDALFRSRCVEAFGELAGDEARPELEAFAALDAETDPQEDIKGAALRALYPRHWTWAELERSVTPSRRELYLGLYQIFLLELPDRIRLEEVPAALRYLSRFRDPTDLLPLVRERLLARAMETLTTEEGLRHRNIVTAVADALRHTVIPLQVPGDEGEPGDTSLGDPESERRCREVWQGSDPARHAVLRRLIESCSEADPSRRRASLLANALFGGLPKRDFDHLLPLADKARSRDERVFLFHVLDSLFEGHGYRPTAHLDELWQLVNRHPSLQDTWDSICGGVPLDNTHARVQHEWSRKERLKRQQTGFPEDTLRRLLDLVSRIREGEPNALFRAIDALRGPGSGYRLGDGFWATLDAQPAELAEAVLSGLDRIVAQPRLPSPEEWVGRSSLPGEVGVPLCVTFWGIEAAMRSGDPAKDWPATRWQSLLAAAFQDSDRLPGWFGRVASHRPGAAHKVVRSVLRASLRNDREGCRPAALLAHRCPIECFGRLALGELQRGPKLEPGAMKDLISLVLASRVKGIEALVQERLDPAAWAAGGKERRGQALLLAAWWWLDAVPAFSWLKERLLTDEAHRAASLLAFHEAATDLEGRQPGDERLIDHISSAAISDLLPHIFEAFAPETDSRDQGGYGVSPEHKVRDFRDLCLGALAERADEDAREAMERLRLDPRMVPWRDIVEHWTDRLKERWLERAWKPIELGKIRVLTGPAPKAATVTTGTQVPRTTEICEEDVRDKVQSIIGIALMHGLVGPEEITRERYEDLVQHSRDYHVFVDGFTREVRHRLGRRQDHRGRLGHRQLSMVAECTLGDGALQPANMKAATAADGQKFSDPGRTWRDARRIVDVPRQSNLPRMFLTVPGPTPGLTAYQFAPEPALHYCIILPLIYIEALQS